MRLDDLQQSNDIEDRRGQSGGMLGGGGGRIGLGSLVLAAVGYFLFGINPSTTLDVVNGGNSAGAARSAPASAGLRSADEQAVFVSKILQSTKEVWTEAFGGRYVAPKLVLYTGRVNTACGMGQAAAGPFYCPGDQKVYLDLGFFRELERGMGAGGDFAQAYVIAHEVAHHVQYLTGIEGKVSQARQRASEAQANALSVRLELQADCYAGVWAARANAKHRILEQGDIQEGLNAAHKIGDDYLQKQAQGYVVPDSFTHGTSAQRMQWFKRGVESGDPKQCNTFS